MTDKTDGLQGPRLPGEADTAAEIENIYTAGEESFWEEEPEEAPPLMKPGKTFSLLLNTQLVILALAAVLGLIFKKYWWLSFHLDVSVFWGAALAVFLLAMSGLLYLLRGKLPFTNMDWMMDTLYIPLFGKLSGGRLLLLALASGLCEEALFRGVLCSGLGLFWSSLIFGLLHMGHKKLIFSGLWIMGMGALLGFSYEWTGNLLVPVAAHTLNNLIGFIVLKRETERRLQH